jgi:hypothetical protein
MVAAVPTGAPLSSSTDVADVPKDVVVMPTDVAVVPRGAIATSPTDVAVVPIAVAVVTLTGPVDEASESVVSIPTEEDGVTSTFEEVVVPNETVLSAPTLVVVVLTGVPVVLSTGTLATAVAPTAAVVVPNEGVDRELTVVSSVPAPTYTVPNGLGLCPLFCGESWPLSSSIIGSTTCDLA